MFFAKAANGQRSPLELTGHKVLPRKARPMLMGFNGLGDYSDSTPCSSIPAGDPYRVEGNYCTQPSGNVIGFNADGSVDPDPFAVGTTSNNYYQPTSSGNQATGTSPTSSPWWSTALTALVKGVAPSGSPGPIMMAPTPWYKTPLGMGGIALGLVAGYIYFKK